MSDRTGRSKKIETRALIAKLSPAGRRRYLELILVFGIPSESVRDGFSGR
jgi:hypothetical protein